MEGESVVSERVAQRWFQHFNIGEENTKDLPPSGRPRLWDIKSIHRVLEENSHESTRRLSEEFSASKDTIHRQIKILRKSYRNCISVPHELILNRLIIEWIFVASLLVIPSVLNLSELSHVMENESIAVTLTPRNSGSVPVNLPKSWLKKSIRHQSNVCVVKF